MGSDDVGPIDYYHATAPGNIAEIARNGFRLPIYVEDDGSRVKGLGCLGLGVVVVIANDNFKLVDDPTLVTTEDVRAWFRRFGDRAHLECAARVNGLLGS
jgi:hypothetical protein